MSSTIDVEAVFADVDSVVRERLVLAEGATVAQALSQFAQQDTARVDLSTFPVGIFGRVVTLSTVLRAGDRLEIYRPLEADPKEARRRRARKRPTPPKTSQTLG